MFAKWSNEMFSLMFIITKFSQLCQYYYIISVSFIVRLQCRNWLRWSPCLALMCLVLLEESPLHPVAGLLCAAMGLCALAFQFLLCNDQKVKQVCLLLNSFFLNLDEFKMCVQICFRTIVFLVSHPLPACQCQLMTANINVLLCVIFLSISHAMVKW